VQDIIEEVIRALGFVVLRILTFGRYSKPDPEHRHVEGAVGLLAIALVAWLVGRSVFA
jgi:hypothetical protein